MWSTVSTLPQRDQITLLKPKPIFPTNAIFILVVVCRCTKMTKNHLRNPNVVYRMLHNVDTIAVITHCNSAIFGNINTDFSNRINIWFLFLIASSIRLTWSLQFTTPSSNNLKSRNNIEGFSDNTIVC